MIFFRPLQKNHKLWVIKFHCACKYYFIIKKLFYRAFLWESIKEFCHQNATSGECFAFWGHFKPLGPPTFTTDSNACPPLSCNYRRFWYFLLENTDSKNNFSSRDPYKMLISVIQNSTVYFGTSFFEFLIFFFLFEFFRALELFSDTCGAFDFSSFWALSASDKSICEIMYSSSVINALGLIWINFTSVDQTTSDDFHFRRLNIKWMIQHFVSRKGYFSTS